MTRLDSSAAWKSATRMVAANRDMLMAIAGVFFLLPGLLGAIILPKPNFAPDMSEQQVAEALTRFYGDAFPLLILLSLPLIVGFMTMLNVMLDRERPTVGAAIGRSIRALPSYLGAQILSGLALSALWLMALALLTILLPPVLAVVISLGAMIYPVTRLLLVVPEIAVRQVRSPIAAMVRSIRLTRANFAAIALYFGPAFLLFFVIYGLVMIFVGVVLVQTTGGESQRLLGEAIIGVLFAVGYTYFAAMIASTHQQLAGSDADNVSVFE